MVRSIFQSIRLYSLPASFSKHPVASLSCLCRAFGSIGRAPCYRPQNQSTERRRTQISESASLSCLFGWLDCWSIVSQKWKKTGLSGYFGVQCGIIVGALGNCSSNEASHVCYMLNKGVHGHELNTRNVNHENCMPDCFTIHLIVFPCRVQESHRGLINRGLREGFVLEG